MTDQNADQSLRTHIRQVVRAPIERVYAAYVDPALMPKWMGIKAITDASGPLDRPGTTFVEVVFGPYRPHTEVLAAEPPVLHDMGGRSIRGIGWRWTARFAEKADGTEITLDEEVRFPPRPHQRAAPPHPGRRTHGAGGACAPDDLREARRSKGGVTEMETLARWAGYLAIAGGALLAVMLVVVVFTDPATSPAWNLF